MIYLDTETDSLNTHNAELKLLQILQDDDLTLKPYPNREEICAYLSKQTQPICGHKIQYDFAVIGWIPPDIDAFEDTFYLSRLVDFEEKYHSLDAVAERVLKRDPYAGMDKKAMQKRMPKVDWNNATEDELRYAETDVLILPPIWARFAPNNQHGVYRFDKRTVLACLELQQHGIPVDRRTVRQKLAEQQQIFVDLCANLPFNPNSPKQVTAALGIESSSDKVLAECVDEGNTVAADVRAARKAKKAANFLSKFNRDDRFYGHIEPTAKTGRTTSNNENLQNLPRVYKALIKAPPGSVLVAADYAQLELRTIACVAEDQVMLDLFKKGEDLHAYTAVQLFGEDFTKRQRYIAKTFNFSLLYGSGAATVQSMLLTQTGINLPEHEVAKNKRTWLNTYKGIAKWQKQGGARHERGIPWRTPHGRPYRSERYTDHLSFENQGAGAEVARLALLRMVANRPASSQVINFVHDSFLAECAEDETLYKEMAKVMYDSMKSAWKDCPLKPVERFGMPMPVDVGVAATWADAENLENCLFIYGDTND